MKDRTRRCRSSLLAQARAPAAATAMAAVWTRRIKFLTHSLNFTRIEENISWKRWSKNKKAASKNISFNCASWTPKWSPLLYRPNWDSYYRRFICMDWTLKSLLKATLLSGLLYARADSLFTVAIFLTVFRFELLKLTFLRMPQKFAPSSIQFWRLLS